MVIDLLPEEKIISVKRRHWFVLFLEALPVAVFAVVALAAPFAVAAVFPEESALYRQEIFIFSGLAVQAALLIFFLIFTDYYLDLWLVTNRRVVFSEINGLFSRRTSSVDFSRIQDISVSVHGIIPTLLNFGDLEIQTAGALPPFVFRQIPGPDRLKHIIVDLKRRLGA